jgi:hypothetical protein
MPLGGLGVPPLMFQTAVSGGLGEGSEDVEEVEGQDGGQNVGKEEALHVRR